MRKSRKTYTDEEFSNAVKSSFSIAEVLRKIGLLSVGGNYRGVHASVRRLGLDTSHWLGRAHLRGKIRFTKKTPLSEVLVENSEFCRTTLKKRLLLDGILINVCSICGQQPEWNGKPLVLVLDHINGTNNDNRIENLRILCPHCHSQTDTFCGRKWRDKKPKKKNHCVDCGVEISRKAKKCTACGIRRKIIPRSNKEIPVVDTIMEFKETFKKEIESNSWEELGRKYGVSGNAIKKKARKMGIDFKPRISKQKIHCKDCGKELINKNTTRCRKCYKINRHENRISLPTQEEFEELSKTMTQKEIAQKYSVSFETLRSRLRREKI